MSRNQVQDESAYAVTATQMQALDKIRQRLYMLSEEAEMPSGVGDAVTASAWSLYSWLRQFDTPRLVIKETINGVEHEWPTSVPEYWRSKL